MKFGFYSCMVGMPWGGSEVLWSKVANRMLDRGDDVTVNYRWWPNQAAQLHELEEKGASVCLRNEPLRPNWTTRLINRFRNNPVDTRQDDDKISQWLNTEKPDMVHITIGYHTDRIAPADECIKRKIPYTINVQCASHAAFISDSFVEDFRRAYTNAEKVYFVSEENRNKVETNIAMKLDNAEIIDNPFNIPDDADPVWPDSGPVFHLACVGRIHFISKGQDLLVDVFKQPKWKDRNLKVTFYGKNQGNRRQLRDLIRLNGLQRSLKFGGFVENIEDLWSSNHGLILPSRYEGAALVVVEAMMCNRMCITTDTGRNRELIDHGETGFIADAPNPEAIDVALEQAWRKRKQWEDMGKVAGERIRQRYGADPVGDLLDRLTNCVDSSSNRRSISAPIERNGVQESNGVLTHS